MNTEAPSETPRQSSCERTDCIQVFHLYASDSLVPPASHPDDSDIPTSSDLLLLKPHLPARMPSCAKMLKRQTGGSLRDDLL